MKKVPKYVIEMLKRRTKLAKQLRNACMGIDNYCQSIGLDADHPLASPANNSTDVQTVVPIWMQIEVL